MTEFVKESDFFATNVKKTIKHRGPTTGTSKLTVLTFVFVLLED